MISRSPIQTLWQHSSGPTSTLLQKATHYSFSVSDENSVFIVQHRSDENADYLLIVDLLSNQIRELKFAPIRTSNETAQTRIWSFEECGLGFGVINFRTDQQTFGVAICTLNFRNGIIHSEEIQLLSPPNPHIHDTTIYTTRKAKNGNIYLLEDPIFPMQIYSLENGYVDGENCIRLRYDIQQRRRQLEGNPEDYMCINDGIDKTCLELSIFLAHRKSGSVHNYITKLTSNSFPLKCQGRLVGNMQSMPFEDGVLALFGYEAKETWEPKLSSFAYLDLKTLQWQDLNIQLDAENIQFQVVGPGENILLIMETENDSNANPIVKAIHRLKIGSMESLQQLCYYTLLKHMPKVRTMNEEERRQHGIVYFL